MKSRLLICRKCVFFAITLLQISIVQGATVIESSAPTLYAAPTAAQLVDFSSLIASFGGPPATVIGLRTSPSNEINPGLDGPLPSTVDGSDTLEVGVVPFPTLSSSCPAGTPVTITVSDWSITLANASPGASGAGGGGGALVDTRNLSFSAPATMATQSGTSNPNSIGGTNVIGTAQYTGTFADLQFLTLAITVNAVRRSGGSYVQSHYRVDLPSLSLEYDDAACSAITKSPVDIPVMGLAHLLTLSGLIPLLTLLVGYRRRRC